VIISSYSHYCSPHQVLHCNTIIIPGFLCEKTAWGKRLFLVCFWIAKNDWK
jgi:hypothetical protein